VDRAKLDEFLQLPVPWTGFYNYGRSPRKHRMDLVLIFSNHTISGDGSDDIGRFFLAGLFDGTNGVCTCPRFALVNSAPQAHPTSDWRRNRITG